MTRKDTAMPNTLPPGLSSERFQKVINELTAALGRESVIDDPQALLEYRDPYSYRYSDEFDASAVVTPTTTEQVQAVVKIANAAGIPLWTISQGRNNTYGGPAPRVAGSIIVSLRNMNRVVEINTDLAYAVVEPGVRWFDLYDALRAAGDHLWVSIPDLGWGSVIGNSLDYGVGYSPNGDHAAMLCGLEVVLPDGEILRTGFGAAGDNPAWHVYHHAFGPSIEGLFKQSGMGIVTRAGVWLLPKPERYTSGALIFRGDEALEKAIDALRGLLLEDVITNLPMITRGIEVDAQGHEYIDPTTDRWSARFALYGTAQLNEARLAVISERIKTIPGVELRVKHFDGHDHDTPATHDEKVQIGIPDMDLLNPDFLPFGDHTAHLDLSPTGVATGKDVVRLQRLMADLYAAENRAHVGGIYLNKRHALQFTTTFYDPRDRTQTAAVFAAYGRMIDALAEEGYLPYRTNLQHMDAVSDKFSFGEHAFRRFVERIKDAVDPAGILAPGKQGVWPAKYRSQ